MALPWSRDSLIFSLLCSKKTRPRKKRESLSTKKLQKPCKCSSRWAWEWCCSRCVNKRCMVLKCLLNPGFFAGPDSSLQECWSWWRRSFEWARAPPPPSQVWCRVYVCVALHVDAFQIVRCYDDVRSLADISKQLTQGMGRHLVSSKGLSFPAFLMMMMMGTTQGRSDLVWRLLLSYGYDYDTTKW